VSGLGMCVNDVSRHHIIAPGGAWTRPATLGAAPAAATASVERFDLTRRLSVRRPCGGLYAVRPEVGVGRTGVSRIRCALEGTRTRPPYPCVPATCDAAGPGFARRRGRWACLTPAC